MTTQEPEDDDLHAKILAAVNQWDAGAADAVDAQTGVLGPVYGTSGLNSAGTPDAPPPKPGAPVPAAPAAEPKQFDTAQPINFAPPTPKAFAPPDATKPEDTGLREAQDKDDRSKRMARLGQAVTAMGEQPTNFLDYAIGLGRGGKSAAPAHNRMYDEQAANGDGAVAQLGAQRKADADMATSQASAAKSAAAKDPNSETARIYRAVLTKFAPDLASQLEGATPEQMEKMQPWLAQYADDNAATLKSQAAIEEAKRKQAQHDAERTEDKKTSADRFDRTDQRSRESSAATLALAKANLGVRQGEIDRAKDDKAQAGAQHLGDKAGEGQSAAKALDEIDATIAKDPENIPGVGKWTSKIPDFAQPFVLSDEGLGVRNNAKDVLGVLLHKRSGAAVSPAELARYEQMYGLNGDAEQFKAGMARLRRDFGEELRAVEAGVSPEARQKFKAAGGKLADDIAPRGSAQSSAKPSPGPGYVRGTVDGKPGWINQAAGEWEPD